MPDSYLLTVNALLAGGSTMRPRGAVARLWDEALDQQHEIMVAGPAETGKTYGCSQWLHEKLLAHPRAQAVMVRRQYTDLIGTAVQTYVNRVLGWESYPKRASPDGVTVYGGQKPQWFDYPNGSRLWLAGMDNPGDALSSERDYIYAPQAEELTLNDWEIMLTRATGRAGNVPFPRVFGDCNPGPPSHWILGRSRGDDAPLLLLHSRHRDNPALYDDAGQLTEQGERTMRVLDNLTGERRQRLRDGLWVAAEGAYYADLIAAAREQGRIRDTLPIDSVAPVHTSWDLGVDDYMAIWWFQVVGTEWRWLHYFEHNGEGLPFYADYLDEWKRERQREGHRVRYGAHYWPHDGGAREMSSGRTREETMRGLGYGVTVVPQTPLGDQHEAVRGVIPNSYYAERWLGVGLDRLTGYRKAQDKRTGLWLPRPEHDENSHGASATATGAVGYRPAAQLPRASANPPAWAR